MLRLPAQICLKSWKFSFVERSEIVEPKWDWSDAQTGSLHARHRTWLIMFFVYFYYWSLINIYYCPYHDYYYYNHYVYQYIIITFNNQLLIIIIIFFNFLNQNLRQGIVRPSYPQLSSTFFPTRLYIATGGRPTTTSRTTPTNILWFIICKALYNVILKTHYIYSWNPTWQLPT